MTTHLAPEPLSLADLEAFDPHAPAGAGTERRFCCPGCGTDKPRDTAHRSLSLNTATGAWNCYRCETGGKLREHWTERPRLSRRDREAQARQQRRAAYDLTPRPAPRPELTAQADNWREHLADLRDLAGTPGADYLARRGIPLDLAVAAGVRYAPTWFGRRPAVVFPALERTGELVATQGRYIDGRDDPKTRTAGPAKAGAFHVPSTVNGRPYGPRDTAAPAVIVTEAPIDALSVAVAGYPALALFGAGMRPAWLHTACGLRRVLLAFDADDTGDVAASELRALMEPYGATCERLRPDGGKDWNELLLTLGADGLADLLAALVLAPEME